MNPGQHNDYSYRAISYNGITGYAGKPLTATYNVLRSDLPTTVNSTSGPMAVNSGNGAAYVDYGSPYEQIEVVKFHRTRKDVHWFLPLETFATFTPGTGSPQSPPFDLQYQVFFLPPSWFDGVDMSTLCWNNLPDVPGVSPALTDGEMIPLLYELHLESEYYTHESYPVQIYTPDVVAGLLFRIVVNSVPSNVDVAFYLNNDIYSGGFALVPKNDVMWPVTFRESSSVTKTVTIGSHNVQVGEYVRPHGIGTSYNWNNQSTSGPYYEGFPVTAVTATTITYTANSSLTESSTACSGVIEVL